jgi:hypothetical protein
MDKLFEFIDKRYKEDRGGGNAGSESPQAKKPKSSDEL